MAKLFGTDGIRGTVNAHPMTSRIAMDVAVAAGHIFREGLSHRPTVLIAKDTRLSGYQIEPAMVTGFTSAGWDVLLLGPMPTPAVAALTRSMRADMGVMLSASHNPYHDNGIKLFGAQGYKLTDDIEAKIEALVERMALEGPEFALADPDKLGRVRRLDGAAGRYMELVKASFPDDLRLDGLKVAVDCANGAGYKAGPELLRSLGAKVIAIGINPNGMNINQKCGSTNPNKIKLAVKKHKAHLGISLDGDADRIIMSDELGNIIDGDQIIAALATRWKNKKMLKGGVVGTLMSNYGLEKFFKSEKIKFIRANVGDRYVKENMQKNNFNLGGEQSGHIILGKFATTGDGLLVALEVLFAIRKGRKASDFFNKFQKTPQILKNIEVKDKEIIKSTEVKKYIKIAEKLIKGQGRILVRKSGTESKIRVMAESNNKKLLNNCINIISKRIK